MVYAMPGATVRPMIRRPASMFLVSALVAIQLLVGAFAEAAPLSMDATGCAGDWPAHAATDRGMGSGDHRQLPAGAAHHGSNGAGQHHASRHIVCRCGCAHTPAMGTSALVMLNPSPPADAISPLAGSTFDPPLFDFLRPPN